MLNTLSTILQSDITSRELQSHVRSGYSLFAYHLSNEMKDNRSEVEDLSLEVAMKKINVININDEESVQDYGSDDEQKEIYVPHMSIIGYVWREKLNEGEHENWRQRLMNVQAQQSPKRSREQKKKVPSDFSIFGTNWKSITLKSVRTYCGNSASCNGI